MMETGYGAMSWVDILISAIIFFSALISIARGFAKEAISLGTWILAIFVATHFYQPLADLLSAWINTPSVRTIVAFVALFAGTMLIGGMFNYLLSGLINKTGMGGFNRLVGVLFGFARGVLVVGVLVLLSRHTVVAKDPWWQDSRLIPHFEPIADAISRAIPARFHTISRLLANEPVAVVSSDGSR